ncbi:NADPH-dependent glutamate synthase beta chain [Desulfocicer vacuolatum DSM 3385]|uniref:NADPH-dependent glutamate synthase beta chain n=1 Tax=Desulfocicer vacuolatum DSM 3385 TaxID=1121400 RepID=A0A1W2E6E3_9BACT|nr:FAD-dependent oxidoreductase [Desulfocicer vacuolatum]SMD05369.1 NADPH-dependent glutamate synthase beta chain [Desulfocicer vacuolatum DSM 3385]
MKRKKDRLRRVMVIGATPSGILAANKLGELDIPVTLVDCDPDMDKKLADPGFTLKSGVPFNHAHRPGLIRLMRNPDISCILPARVNSIKHNMQGFKISVVKEQTFVDTDTCTLCGRCVETCPVTLEDGTKPVTVISRRSLPGRAIIDKRKTPLCSTGCPLGVNVQGYVALAGRGRFQKALDLIRRENILPGICGRICTHPCEDECRRTQVDEPLSIRAIKRFVADVEDDRETSHKPAPVFVEGRKIAVIGSGPAGLAAAHELVSHGCRAVIFEEQPEAGGLLRYGIGPHRLPGKILKRELAHIKASGVEIRTSRPMDLESDLTGLKKEYDAIILATGSWCDRKLGVPGENLKGVRGCISFLTDFHAKKEHDLPQNVIVIGDGNAAFDLARVVSRTGSRVTMVSWFEKDNIPADHDEIREALEEGIAIRDQSQVVQFLGDNGRVTGVMCKATRPGKPVDNGIAWPEIIEDSEPFTMAADLVLVAIGQTGAYKKLSKAGEFNVNASAYLEPRNNGAEKSHIYVAGDATGGTATVVHAMAQGKSTARQALNDLYQLGLDGNTQRVSQRDFPDLCDTLSVMPRAVMPEQDPAQRIKGYDEVALGLSRDQVVTEAARCLQCGVCSECMECVDVCNAIKAIDHREAEEEFAVHAGVVILADPSMAPAVKGDDIIRAYGPKSSHPDVHAMMMRGFAAAAQAMILLKNGSWSRKGSGVAHAAPTAAFSPGIARTGVFVCRCNDSLGWDGAMDQFVDSLLNHESVVHSTTMMSACTPEGISQILKTVRTKSLSRIVLASCVCCPLNFVCSACTDQRSRLKHGLFTGTGIGRSMVETCNIRGEALSLLEKDRDLAVERLKGLITRSIGRAEQLRPFASPMRNYNFTTAVIGDSEASVTSAMMLAETGTDVVMFGGTDKPLETVVSHENIFCFKGSSVRDMTGTLGNFQINVDIDGERQEFNAGTVIMGERSRRQIKYLHQQKLAYRTVSSAMQEKDKVGRPYILPGMTSIPGIFLADPSNISVSNRQKGASAAVLAAAIMPRGPRKSKGFTVVVDADKCRGCGRCVAECAYQAVTLSPNGVGGWAASVDEAFCKGCGNCISVCPTNAADSPYRDQVFLERSLEEMLL